MKKILKNLKRRFTVLAVAMIAIQPVLVGAVMMPARTFAAANDVTGVVINEMLPNPAGTDASNEWIELYNNGAITADLTGWSLVDAASTSYSLTGTIAPGGYLVLTDSATGITLTNDSETLTLKNGITEINSVTYASAAEGSSYARKPNGTGGFVWDATPTSGIVNNTVPTTPVLSTLTSGTITNDNTPSFTWNPSDVDVDGDTITYNIEGSSANDFSVTSFSGGSAGTAFTATTLADGTYYWRVRANDGYANSNSTWSDVFSFIVDTTKPEPAVLSITAGDGKITLSWSTLVDPAPSSGIKTVDVYRDGLKIATVDIADGNTYIDNGVANGTSYEYYVVVNDNADNVSEDSNEVTATPKAIVLSPVVTTVVPAVATVVVSESVVQNDQFGGSSEQGEVKADTEIKADDGNNTENKDEQKEDVKEKKNIPLWGIIFLLILAGIGGYLFYSQSPEKVNGKK